MGAPLKAHHLVFSPSRCEAAHEDGGVRGGSRAGDSGGVLLTLPQLRGGASSRSNATPTRRPACGPQGQLPVPRETETKIRYGGGKLCPHLVHLWATISGPRKSKLPNPGEGRGPQAIGRTRAPAEQKGRPRSPGGPGSPLPCPPPLAPGHAAFSGTIHETARQRV